MSEKSVSQIANERREKDHESSRKSLSPNKGKTQNPNTNWGRQEQLETSVAKGQLNLGSNQNMGLSMNPKMRPNRHLAVGLVTARTKLREVILRLRSWRTVQSTTERYEKALWPSASFRAITVSKSPTADQRTFDPNEKTPSERLIQGESAHRPFDTTTIQPKVARSRAIGPSRYSSLHSDLDSIRSLFHFQSHVRWRGSFEDVPIFNRQRSANTGADFWTDIQWSARRKDSGCGL